MGNNIESLIQSIDWIKLAGKIMKDDLNDEINNTRKNIVDTKKNTKELINFELSNFNWQDYLDSLNIWSEIFSDNLLENSDEFIEWILENPFLDSNIDFNGNIYKVHNVKEFLGSLIKIYKLSYNIEKIDCINFSEMKLIDWKLNWKLTIEEEVWYSSYSSQYLFNNNVIERK